MDPAIPADPLDARRSGDHGAAAAWAWNGPSAHAALGQDRPASNIRSYMSPFMSGPPPAPLHDEDDLDDADALLSFRVPADSRQKLPGDERNRSRSPIGKQPIGQVHRRKASFSGSKMDPYSGTGGVSLTLLQDDGLSTDRHSRFEPSSKSDAMSSEYMHSPFSTTNMLHSHSLTSSPLSTPSQNMPSSSYQTHSNHSPTHSPETYHAAAYSTRTHSSQGAHHHLPALVHTARSSQQQQGSEFDMVDKSLAGMFIHQGGSRDNREGGRDIRDTREARDPRDGRDRDHDARGEYNGGHMSQSTSGNNLRDYPPQQQQHQSAYQQQQQQQQSSHSQSTSPNHTYLPPVVAPSVSAPPPSSAAGNSSNSGVAYVVLPNGQVQAISMATIQQHLQPSATAGGRPPIPSQSPPVQQSYHNTTPPMQQSYQQPSAYDAPSDDSFSLATLSTQTLPLPLFTPPISSHPHHNSAQRSNNAPYQSQQALLAPLSSQYAQPPPQLQQQPPSRPSSSVGSTSPYTSPTLPGMSMQQRSSLRRDSAGAGPHQHHRTSSNGNLLEQQQQQQQMLTQHSPNPMPISPLSSPNMQTPPLQQQQQQPQQRPSGGMPSVSIEHAREQVRLVSAQMNSSYPLQSPTSLHYHGGNNGEGMVALAKSQAGSRLLQTKLGQNDPVYFTSVFEEVYEAVPDLMTDLFGNYLVQKIVSVANDTQRLQLLLKVLPQLLEISCDRQGTRAIQKLIDSLKHASERQLVLEWLSMPMQGALPPPRDRDGQIIYIGAPIPSASPSPPILTPISSPPSAPTSSPVSPVGGAPSQPPATALTLNGVTHPAMPRLIHLIRDANGSHVVHSILDSFPPDMLSAIYCNAVHNCRSLGIDQHGLCVLKKCLSMCPLSDFVHFTLGFILDHALEFVNNQYGNYLIQHILERTNNVMANTSPPNFAGFAQKGTAAVNPAAAAEQAKQAQAAVAELASTLASTPTPTPAPADATPVVTADDKNAAAAAVESDPAVPASSTAQPKSPEQKAATPPVAAAADAPTAAPSAVPEPTVEDAATAAARAQLPAINETLFVRLRGHFARLSRQKFSSNVVEKCLKIPDQSIRSAIIAELIEADAIATLLLCSYGNYVLQNVLYVASADECALLFSRVRPEHVLSSLRKNIRLKWERLLANAHLIHPSLTSLNLGSGLATQPMQLPLPLASPPGGFNPAAGLNVDVNSPEAAAPAHSSPLLDTPTSSPQYPTPSAIQLITSILGANTPGTGVGITDDGRTTPALVSSALSTPMQLSPAIRSVNHSPMGPRGHFSSSRAGSVTPGQQQPLYSVMMYPSKGPQDRRTLIGTGSQNASAVNSPYYSGSAGPSPGFAPHRGPLPHSSSGGGSQYGGSSATSPMLGANSPYGGPSNNQYSSHNYSREREPSDRYHSQQQPQQQQQDRYQPSNNQDGGYSQQPQQQPAPYRASPNYPSSTNYNTNPSSYGNSSANSPSIKYISNNPLPPSRSQQGMPQQSVGGSNSGQTIEQQIQAHQAQLNALLALQAQSQQQPPQQQSSSGYSVTLLPSPQGPHQHQSSSHQHHHYSSSNYNNNAPSSRGGGNYNNGGHNPNSPPLMHQSHNQQQQQQTPQQYQQSHRDERY